MKTVFAALHENNSETFSTKLKRIKIKIFIPKTSYADHLLASLRNRSRARRPSPGFDCNKEAGPKTASGPAGATGMDRLNRSPGPRAWLSRARHPRQTRGCASMFRSCQVPQGWERQAWGGDPGRAARNAVTASARAFADGIRLGLQPSADCSAARTTSGFSVGTKLSIKA